MGRGESNTISSVNERSRLALRDLRTLAVETAALVVVLAVAVVEAAVAW